MFLKVYSMVIFAFFIPGTTCQTAEVFVEEGSRAVLPCESHPGVPTSPTIIWTKVHNGTVWKREQSGLQYWGQSWFNKGFKRVHCPHTAFERGNYSLHISRVRQDDGGLYSCKVDFNGHMTRRLVMLHVMERTIEPKTDVTMLYAAAGSSVTLPCIFNPGSRPLSSTWEKLTEDSVFGPVVTSSSSSSSPPVQLPWDKSASINAVGLEHEGLYRCVGTVEGQTLTHSIRLVVAEIIPSKINDSLTLTCTLSDTSEVTQYQWVHVTSGSNGTESAEIIHSGKKARIYTVSEKDINDKWTCRFYGKNGTLGNVTYQVETVAALSEQTPPDMSYNTTTVAGISIFILVLLLILAHVLYKNHQRRKMISKYSALETIVHTISKEQTEREKESKRKSDEYILKM